MFFVYVIVFKKDINVIKFSMKHIFYKNTEQYYKKIYYRP